METRCILKRAVIIMYISYGIIYIYIFVCKCVDENEITHMERMMMNKRTHEKKVRKRMDGWNGQTGGGHLVVKNRVTAYRKTLDESRVWLIFIRHKFEKIFVGDVDGQLLLLLLYRHFFVTNFEYFILGGSHFYCKNFFIFIFSQPNPISLFVKFKPQNAPCPVHFARI